MTKPAKPQPAPLPARVQRVLRAAIGRYEIHALAARLEGGVRCGCPLCPPVRAYLKAEAKQ